MRSSRIDERVPSLGRPNERRERRRARHRPPRGRTNARDAEPRSGRTSGALRVVRCRNGSVACGCIVSIARDDDTAFARSIQLRRPSIFIGGETRAAGALETRASRKTSSRGRHSRRAASRAPAGRAPRAESRPRAGPRTSRTSRMSRKSGCASSRNPARHSARATSSRNPLRYLTHSSFPFAAPRAGRPRAQHGQHDGRGRSRSAPDRVPPGLLEAVRVLLQPRQLVPSAGRWVTVGDVRGAGEEPGVPPERR